MQNKPLVSVLTPAFNTGKYISKLLDSILSQSYPNIEMIVIDDGSTDDTEKIVNKYIPLFTKRNYILKYIFQNNSGQSVAINNGLKLVRGKYLVWPDSDDYYNSDVAIERMVSEFLRYGEAVGIVRTQERIIKNTDNGIIEVGYAGLLSKPYYRPKEIFEDCLLGRNNFFFCAGAYMLDTDLLKRCNGLDIYTEKNAGQNWQLMLPMLYSYDCVTIMEPLYNVVAREESHSRGQYNGYEAEMAKYSSYLNTLLATLERIRMPSDEKKKYSQLVIDSYNLTFFNLAFKYAKRLDGLAHYQRLSLADRRNFKILLKRNLLWLGVIKPVLLIHKYFNEIKYHK